VGPGWSRSKPDQALHQTLYVQLDTRFHNRAPGTDYYAIHKLFAIDLWDDADYGVILNCDRTVPYLHEDTEAAQPAQKEYLM